MRTKAPSISNAITADQRLPMYQSAIHDMCNRRFNIDIQPGPLDAFGVLGRELAKLAESMEHQFEEMRQLQYITEQVSSGLFLDDVLGKIFETFHRVIPYNRIGVSFLSDDQSLLTHYWGRSDSDVVKIMPGYSAPMAGSSLQSIIETGRPRILNDLESYIEHNPQSSSTNLVVSEGIRSSLTCPLVAYGKHIGFLFFSSFTKNTYSDVHQQIYLQLAVQVSLLVEKSRLYQRLFEVNQELLKAKAVLHDQAMHDELTGLYNRRAILDLLRGQISRAKRERFPLSLLMIDIDFFKKINDDYGHHVGDMVLQAVATCLSHGVRDYNQISRYGGEEFLVVLEGEDAEAAAMIGERLREAVAEEIFDASGERCHLTVSVGVAISTHITNADPIPFISLADSALYDAKHKGRNCVEVRRID